jgi:transposase-like protein
MKPKSRRSAAWRVPSATKAEIMEKYLFKDVSTDELSSQYGVSQSSIRLWRDRVREGLESFFVSDSEKTKALCLELTSLKKELGEI